MMGKVASVALCAAVCGWAVVAPGSPEKSVYQPQAHVRLGGFWAEHCKRLVCRWLPHCIRQMEAGGEGEELMNLVHAGEVLRTEGVGDGSRPHYKGCKWSDACVFNLVEAISLALEIDPGEDAEMRASQAFLRAKLDAWVPIILAAQEPSGYIDSYMLLASRPHFTQTNDHEWHVMGSFIEMGLAHRRATGDTRLFDAAVKCADFLDGEFGPAPERTWMNDHPGLEYALCRLSDATGDDRYARLAQYMIHHQHTQQENRQAFCQADKPASDMREAKGHVVRANNFYAGMAAVANRLNDHHLGDAALALFGSIIDHKFYLTGGVGSDYTSEAYERDYKLPQDAYASSCAGCALDAFAREIRRRAGCDKAEAVRERVLYNNLLGAISRDGTQHFYHNPLDSNRPRSTWHKNPCCVGNIPRTLLALKDTVFSIDGETLYVNQYMALENATIKDDAGRVWHISLKTDYPQNGRVELTTDAPLAVVARFPNRAESALYNATPAVPHGYRMVEPTKTADANNQLKTYVWELPLPEQTVTAVPQVDSCRGKSAYQRGPIVYSWQTFRYKPDVAPVKTPTFERLNDGGFASVWQPSEQDLANLRTPNRREDTSRPLLSGSHPDPSVCIGHDGAYYVAFASCMWMPGLPVIRSENFRDWSIVGHAVDDPRTLQTDRGTLTDNDGIRAPTIRFHDGWYYIVFAFQDASSTRNYITRAKAPLGPWSEPLHIAEADGACDPSLFFDEDGRAYFLASARPAQEAWPGQREILMQRIDVKAGRLIGKRLILTSGVTPKAEYAARPQLHKLGSTYVLFITEGGFGLDQAESVLSARSVYGPYAPTRTNPVLTYRDRGAKSVLQAAGRADLVRRRGSGKSDYYAIFSGHRPLGEDGRIILGYETFACPALWRDEDMIFQDEKTLVGTIISRSEPHTVACAPFPAVLTRIRLRAFDETRHDMHAGDALVVYRASNSYILLACAQDAVELIANDPHEGRRIIGHTAINTSDGVSLRFVCSDGMTVRAYADAKLVGEVSTLVLAEDGGRKQINGVGVGPVKLPAKTP